MFRIGPQLLRKPTTLGICELSLATTVDEVCVSVRLSVGVPECVCMLVYVCGRLGG